MVVHVAPPGLAAASEEDEDHLEASESGAAFEGSKDASAMQDDASEVEQEETNDQDVSKEEDEVAPLNHDSDHRKEVPCMEEVTEEPEIPEPPAPELEDDEQSFASVESPLPVEDDEQSFSSSVESPLPVEVAYTNIMEELVEELEEAKAPIESIVEPQVPQTAEEAAMMKILKELEEANAQYESIVKKLKCPY
jgi:hypothetical protein